MSTIIVTLVQINLNDSNYIMSDITFPDYEIMLEVSNSFFTKRIVQHLIHNENKLPSTHNNH